MLGQGKALAISDRDIADAAVELMVEPAAIDAIMRAESGSFGWFKDGRMKILPEPHVFYAELPTTMKRLALGRGLVVGTTYSETKRSGHYRKMSGPNPRYNLLAKWIAFHEETAYRAISMGRFQIMGFNYKVCGYDSAKEMFNSFCESEVNQLNAFVKFLRNKGVVSAIRTLDFRAVENLYNGGGQKGAYARKMSEYYREFNLKKWLRWDSGFLPDGSRYLVSTPDPVEEEGKKKVARVGFWAWLWSLFGLRS